MGFSAIIAVLLSAGALILPTAAQTSGTSATPFRQQIRDIQQDFRQNIEEVRQNLKGEISQLREGALEEFKEKRLEAKNLIEQKREEFKNTIEEKRAQLQSQIQKNREDLKNRLIKIKDERKKQTVERINNQINELNERRLDHFSDVLEKLEKVLDRIGSRADKAEAHGLDISAVRTAITEANNVIAASRAAIAAQAGKTYTIIISTEAALRTDVGKTRQVLHDDLTKVQETVKAAREAVKKAAVTLAQIPRVDELEVATSTATSTATSSNQ
ncbi:MAG: hypothetical protein UU85_C0003G0035 [Candidatus Wolfebacteria bacterium GW2011_GWA2_42_10]|uniref:Uncharacterized protein n=2 Tax=Candidatus Wolfeibacteriota TaxID=1752735 RepID=A0A0G0XLW5_9BACT|nr:MAG: hypothetical protein UU38_C0001G0020 [Candidatus Wolfebacteria bacterium GW2011_GWB1_41_12]KKS25462.1 MAG: hypothetical protein UU85_C0003G0035 [Candidatus Wolfebacteria bacterium GW2011_GWA2_42_10]KKT56639.1 MAG: hypothetical protein UW50_C0001G0208 [Candidatus Wolfebacteria bacterium GW2011_GWA1_44_24]